MKTTVPEIRRHQRAEGVQFRMLVYGPTKIGKTTFASHLKGDGRVLFIATEPGFEFVQDVDIVEITDWLQFAAFVDKGKFEQYDTVVVDSANGLSELCVAAVARQSGVSHPSMDDKKAPGVWNLVRIEFSKYSNRLAMKAKNLLWTSAERSFEIKKSKFSSVVKLLPDVSSGILRHLLGATDFIGHIADTGGKRRINFQPTEDLEVGYRRPIGKDAIVQLGANERDCAEAANTLFNTLTKETVSV